MFPKFRQLISLLAEEARPASSAGRTPLLPGGAVVIKPNPKPRDWSTKINGKREEAGYINGNGKVPQLTQTLWRILGTRDRGRKQYLAQIFPQLLSPLGPIIYATLMQTLNQQKDTRTVRNVFILSFMSHQPQPNHSPKRNQTSWGYANW